MAGNAPWWRRFLDALLSIGEYPGEPETRRAGRRVLVMGIVAGTLLSIPTALAELGAHQTWAGINSLAGTAVTPLFLLAIHRRPRWFVVVVNAFFLLSLATQLAETAMFGGLLPSGLVVAFVSLYVLGALITMGLRAAAWWFAVFLASILFAVEVPHWFHPIYHHGDPTAEGAMNLTALAIVVFLVLAYFVRQRDQFQRRSDDLLHSILPNEIADRLKSQPGMIAEDVMEASVLFADIVGFTPMSATMSPTELVGLLNEVFTTIDAFAAELGIEKIKTVGDEYMAAAGVPTPRPDHAHAVAALALRIRDHFAANGVRGRRLTFRIGINSGPVTAGIIGTHKFSYDLWGDTVNVASRMESGGVPGSIHVSAATYGLVKDAFLCEPRGATSVKGRGEMETYLLLSRHDLAPAATG